MKLIKILINDDEIQKKKKDIIGARKLDNFQIRKK